MLLSQLSLRRPLFNRPRYKGVQLSFSSYRVHCFPTPPAPFAQSPEQRKPCSSVSSRCSPGRPNDGVRAPRPPSHCRGRGRRRRRRPPLPRPYAAARYVTRLFLPLLSSTSALDRFFFFLRERDSAGVTSAKPSKATGGNPRTARVQETKKARYYYSTIANTLTVQLVSTTRQRSGWLSQPGFESRHHLLKTKIRGTSLSLVESLLQYY
jgi:hypothetical protein